MNLSDVKIIQLPKFLDSRGNLSFVEQKNHIPFEIKRTYWLYDVPGGEDRGGHAYKENQEFERKVFTLNRSYYGLLVPKGLWREMNNFSTNSLALILSSTKYDPNDYVRYYDDFLNMQVNEKK